MARAALESDLPAAPVLVPLAGPSRGEAVGDSMTGGLKLTVRVPIGGSMPTYEYRCANCGHQLEAVQSFTDPALTECPHCGEPTLRKLFGNVGVVFKGSGFYRNDSRAAEKAAQGDKTADSGTKKEGAGGAAAGKESGGTTSQPATDAGSSTSSPSTSSSNTSNSSSGAAKPAPSGAGGKSAK